MLKEKEPIFVDGLCIDSLPNLQRRQGKEIKAHDPGQGDVGRSRAQIGQVKQNLTL
jgi:hypothetical protein